MSLLWIISRSSGLMATLLLSAVVALGILSSADTGSRRWSRFLTSGLHRRLAYLACTMLGLHVLAVVVDTYVDIGALNVFIPFTSSYERFAIGLGAISFDLLIVLMATSLTRRHLPFRLWQVIHLAAYAIWPLAILHGVLAGTDDWLTLAVSAAGALTVGTVALLRLFNHLDGPNTTKTTGTTRPTGRAALADNRDVPASHDGSFAASNS